MSRVPKQRFMRLSHVVSSRVCLTADVISYRAAEAVPGGLAHITAAHKRPTTDFVT